MKNPCTKCDFNPDTDSCTNDCRPYKEYINGIPDKNKMVKETLVTTIVLSECNKRNDFVGYIYDKYGTHPNKKVLSTQELQAEMLEFFGIGSIDEKVKDALAMLELR